MECEDVRDVRPTFILVLRPEPGVDGIRALRGALKTLLRRFGLRAIEVSERIAPRTREQ